LDGSIFFLGMEFLFKPEYFVLQRKILQQLLMANYVMSAKLLLQYWGGVSAASKPDFSLYNERDADLVVSIEMIPTEDIQRISFSLKERA
jgi:hypothetical protein